MTVCDSDNSALFCVDSVATISRIPSYVRVILVLDVISHPDVNASNSLYA